MAFENTRKETPCFPRFAGEKVGQIHRLIAEGQSGIRGRGTEFTDRAVDMGLDVVQFLRRLLPEQGQRFGGEMEVIFFHHGHRLGAGTAVGVGRAAGDAVKRIAQNVTEDDAEYLRRLTGEGKAPALHGRETLADAVHLHNVGTAGKHLARDVLQLIAGDQRKLKERAAAAGEQKNDGILCTETVYQVQCFFCGIEAVLIRDGMAGFIATHAREFAHHMAILGDDDPVVDLPERVQRSFCHLPGRLANCDEKCAPVSGLVILQGALDRGIRENCSKRSTDDLVRVPAQRRVHARASRGRFTTLMGAPST